MFHRIKTTFLTITQNPNASSKRLVTQTTYKSNHLHGKETVHVISKTFPKVHAYTNYNWSTCLSLSDDRAVYTLRLLLLKIKPLSNLHIPLTSLKALKCPYKVSHSIICTVLLSSKRETIKGCRLKWTYHLPEYLIT